MLDCLHLFYMVNVLLIGRLNITFPSIAFVIEVSFVRLFLVQIRIIPCIIVTFIRLMLVLTDEQCLLLVFESLFILVIALIKITLSLLLRLSSRLIDCIVLRKLIERLCLISIDAHHLVESIVIQNIFNGQLSQVKFYITIKLAGGSIVLDNLSIWLIVLTRLLVLCPFIFFLIKLKYKM